MSAKGATMSAKATTMSAKDATMSAKDASAKDDTMIECRILKKSLAPVTLDATRPLCMCQDHCG